MIKKIWIVVIIYSNKYMLFFLLFSILSRKKIDEIMLTNPKIASDISPKNPIGIIFGKEHPGWVRGLSYGACPSLAFKESTTRLSGMNYASSSSTSSNVEDKVIKMETEFATVKNQMNTLLAYIASRKDVLEHFAAMVATLVHASINEVLIYLKIYWCLLFYNYKHSKSLT